MACCYLHNFLCKHQRYYITPACTTSYNPESGEAQPGECSVQNVASLQVGRVRWALDSAREVRITFEKWVNNEGTRPWHNKYVQ
jgi:hypothetical protein